MTQENCKKAICELLEASELNAIIDQLIASQFVGNMLEDSSIEKFIPRAVLSVAIKMELERFKSISETGVSIEETIHRTFA